MTQILGKEFQGEIEPVCWEPMLKNNLLESLSKKDRKGTEYVDLKYNNGRRS
jgi:hypothetical protein